MAAKLVYLEEGVLLAMEAGARAFIRRPFKSGISPKGSNPAGQNAGNGQDVLGFRGVFMGVSKEVQGGILFCKSTIDVRPARV